jgi:hypothetical protein
LFSPPIKKKYSRGFDRISALPLRDGKVSMWAAGSVSSMVLKSKNKSS